MPEILISLSSKTKEINDKRTAVNNANDILANVNADQQLSLEALIEILNSLQITELGQNAPQDAKKLKPHNQSLAASILNDIFVHFKGDVAAEPEPKKKSKIKFWLLAIAGALFFGTEGFDGINAVFGLFSVSSFVSLGVAVVFSFFSAMVFWGFGLRQIAEHLGVKLKEGPALINDYIKQMNSIESLVNNINTALNGNKEDELESYSALLTAMKKQLEFLKSEKSKLDEFHNKLHVKILKNSMAFITGMIFFSSGFFTGQAVALTIAGFFLTASATFPPILAAGIFLGLVAFLIYWNLEKPGVENLIGRKLGIDKEQLEKLSSERTDEIENNITIAQNRVQDKMRIKAYKEIVENDAVRPRPNTQDQAVSVSEEEFSEQPIKKRKLELSSLSFFKPHDSAAQSDDNIKAQSDDNIAAKAAAKAKDSLLNAEDSIVKIVDHNNSILSQATSTC